MQQIATDCDVYLKNMAALWRHDPRLAQQIDDLPIEASLNVVPSKSGPPTASITTADGRTLFLHSRYDPAKEARDFCRSLEKSEALCVILCGLGLGHHVTAIYETFGDETCILVSEPDLVTIKTALEQTDLAKPIAAGRLEILAQPDKASLHDRLAHHSTRLMLGTLFAVPPVSREHNADAHAAIRQTIMDYAAFAKMSLVTLVRNSAITCRNIANNLPTYLSTPPADLFRNRFAGHPAILVAAGPSLARNIDQLKELRERSVIIAAQTTLRPLVERGIHPHFVTSLDFSPISRQFFEGFDPPDDIILVAEPKATWHVIDAFRGQGGAGRRRVILLDNSFAHRCVGEDLARRTPMEAGATVMHLALYLAQWLGCDPIIFVGQDLAFTGHCYYSPGVAMHRAWRPETGRYCTLEMKEWERIVRHRPILRKVRGSDGGELYTDEQMFTYLEQFERDFARSTAKIIDASEGGAVKRGAHAMSLRDAAEHFATQPIERGKFDYLNMDWYDATRLPIAREVLSSRLSELDRFESICTETRDVLKDLEGLTDDPSKFNRRLVRVDELRTLVQQHELIFTMVRDVSQLAELQKFAADRRTAKLELCAAQSGGESQGTERARRQLQRDRQFVGALLEGCAELREILQGARDRLQIAIEGMK